MKNVILVLGVLSLVVFAGVRLVLGIQFNQNCEGYLKRAADANSAEIALVEINKAIAYIESNNLTSGYTSLLYKTPDEDVSFWYNNLKSAQSSLQGIDFEIVSDLEESNHLMKLRETLMDRWR